MPKDTIIVLTGLKRSGKDESAKALIGEGFTRFAFADSIKVACKDIFLLSNEQIDGALKEDIDPRWGISPRRIFQLFGTELMRDHLCELDEGYKSTVGESLWIKRFLEKYKEEPTNYVITDCRFPNELTKIRESFDNVIAIRIERDEVVTNDSHASESQIMNLDVDYVIKNNSSIERLHQEVKHLVLKLKNYYTILVK